MKGPHVTKRPKKFAPLSPVGFIVPVRRYGVSSVLEGKTNYGGQYWAKCVEYLHGRGYLQIEMPATNSHGQGIRLGTLGGINPQYGPLNIEPQLGTTKPEFMCCAHKLSEIWESKRELGGETDLELLEEGGGHPRKERFPVSTITFEPEPANIWKCDMCCEWCVRQLPFNTAVENRGVKRDSKCLELRQERKPLE